MVNFKEIYHFSRFQRGSKIFQGGPTFPVGGGGWSNCLFPIETHITCDFPGGGVRTPCPPLPSGSALAHPIISWSISTKVWYRARGREFDPGSAPYFRGDWSWNNFYGHSPPFRWFIQEGLLSVTSESMCTNNWLTACSSLPRKKVWLSELTVPQWP